MLHAGPLLGVKFIYSEKATKFCEISTLLLSVCTVDKSKVEILQKFLTFSEYTNFNARMVWLFVTSLLRRRRHINLIGLNTNLIGLNTSAINITL